MPLSARCIPSRPSYSFGPRICVYQMIFLTLNDEFLKMVQLEEVNEVFIFITHQLPILGHYVQKFNLPDSFSHRPQH